MHSVYRLRLHTSSSTVLEITINIINHKHPRTNEVVLRSVPGCLIDKTGSIRDCGYAVRVLGRIQRAHLNATGKEENQTKTSFHPPPNKYRRKCIIWKTHLILPVVRVVSVCAFQHVHCMLACLVCVCVCISVNVFGCLR